MNEENKDLPGITTSYGGNKRRVLTACFIMAVAILGLVYYFFFTISATPKQNDNDIVATVGDEIIPRHDVDVRVRQSLVKGSVDGYAVPEAAFFDRGVDDLINESLIYQGALQEGHSASEDEVTLRYEVAQSKFSSEEAFLDRMKENLLTPEEFRNNIKRQIIIFSYLEELKRREVQAELDALPQQVTESGATVSITADHTPLTQTDINRLVEKRAKELEDVFTVKIFLK